MKLRKLFFISLGIVFLSQFIYSNTNKDPYEKALAEYDKLSAKYINDMCQKHNLYPFGDGGGFLENINDLYFCFDTDEDLSYEEYREKLIDISCELLKRVNANPKIRPHLVQFPFDENGLSLQIISSNKAMKQREHITMKIIMLKHKKITFEVDNDLENPSTLLKEETFTEALKKCHMTHPNFELLLDNTLINNK